MKDSAKPAPPVTMKRKIEPGGKDDARSKHVDDVWARLNAKKEKKK